MYQYKYKTKKDIEQSEGYFELLSQYNNANSEYEANIYRAILETHIQCALEDCEEYMEPLIKSLEEFCKEYGDEYDENGLFEL